MTWSTRFLRLIGCGLPLALGCGQQQNPPPAPPPSVTSVADASSESKSAASEIDELLAPRPKDSTSPDSEDNPGGSLAAQRQKLDETVWANERLSHTYEATFVRLWDDLLREQRKGRKRTRWRCSKPSRSVRSRSDDPGAAQS